MITECCANGVVAKGCHGTELKVNVLNSDQPRSECRRWLQLVVLQLAALDVELVAQHNQAHLQSCEVGAGARVEHCPAVVPNVIDSSRGEALEAKPSLGKRENVLCMLALDEDVHCSLWSKADGAEAAAIGLATAVANGSLAMLKPKLEVRAMADRPGRRVTTEQSPC